MNKLPFIDKVEPTRPAVMDDTCNSWISYGELATRAQTWSRRMEGERGLVFVYVRNSVESLAAFLGALVADHAVALFDANTSNEARAELEETYRPAWIARPDEDELEHPAGAGPLHQDVKLLLSTSGSTGSAKLVRLTMDAMQANAEGIAEVLHIRNDDVAAGYLPIHYSYGLSVVTSHLVSGARIRLTEMGLMDSQFWSAMRGAGITHLPGVPFHYQMMLKLGLKRLNLPTLTTMTQAGGRLAPELRKQVHEFMEQVGGRFFVLYGQTEAAPRMTTLQHSDFPFAPQSVGVALPDCRIEIIDRDGDGNGEVVFHGPNVMFGYAENRDDLGRGDEMCGRLPTGDTGYLDAEGRLTLTGRVKRIGKIFGLRINLDEVEALANASVGTAVTQTAETLTLHVVSSGDAERDKELTQAMLASLQKRFTIPVTSYRIKMVPEILRTERGKINYAALESQI